MLEYYDTIGGHLSGAVVSAAPEIATMTLGFYWIKRAINNIDDKGKQLYSVVSAYAGMALCSSTFHYLSKSSLHPESGSDHYGFTKHILDILPLPDAVTAGAAGLTTFIGAAVMTAGALYLANIIPDKSNDFKV